MSTYRVGPIYSTNRVLWDQQIRCDRKVRYPSTSCISAENRLRLWLEHRRMLHIKPHRPCRGNTETNVITSWLICAIVRLLVCELTVCEMLYVQGPIQIVEAELHDSERWKSLRLSPPRNVVVRDFPTLSPRPRLPHGRSMPHTRHNNVIKTT